MHRSNQRRPSLSLLALPFLFGACAEEQAAESAPKHASAAPAAAELPAQPAAATPQDAVELPADAELAAWRSELLQLAMDAASAMPEYPHLKTQAELQQNVVEACVELDQPRRALEYSLRIGNWRRGVGYAALAEWLAEQGVETGLDALVAMAAKESRLEGEENPQDWQRDTIRAMLASALFRVGRAGDAAAFEHELDDAEVGHLAATKASLLDTQDALARLRELDAVLPAANIDQVRSALTAAVELYVRGLDDDELRAECEAWIDRGIRKVPVQIQVEVRLEMATRAAAAGRSDLALGQVDAARALFDGVNWPPEDRVPMLARIAEVRFVAGDEEAARADAEMTLELYREQRETIQDFWRGAALRPLAEAFVTMGADAEALKIYRIAAEEGTSNPNARTRCMDLVANCLSMALHDVQPDANLEARLRKTREGLGDPW